MDHQKDPKIPQEICIFRNNFVLFWSFFGYFILIFFIENLFFKKILEGLITRLIPDPQFFLKYLHQFKSVYTVSKIKAKNTIEFKIFFYSILKIKLFIFGILYWHNPLV